MNQRVDFITLATSDLDATRAFYAEGLGWTPTLDVPGEIIFFQIGRGVMLGLFEATKFAQDLGGSAPTVTPISGVTLSHNVTSADEVDRVVADAARAGAVIVKSPQHASFGGYHGHFADPNGAIWEVAYNPGWQVDEMGKVRLDAVDG
jgi:uncharacterized protein